MCFFCFFFNDPASTEIYTLSLHDALPICPGQVEGGLGACNLGSGPSQFLVKFGDRKSTRLNSSHTVISYAVFCLKKKNTAPAPSTPGRPSAGWPSSSQCSTA